MHQSNKKEDHSLRDNLLVGALTFSVFVGAKFAWPAVNSNTYLPAEGSALNTLVEYPNELVGTKLAFRGQPELRAVLDLSTRELSGRFFVYELKGCMLLSEKELPLNFARVCGKWKEIDDSTLRGSYALIVDKTEQ